ncbi:MAG: AAA family ATPase [Alteromonadaceae bacterium]|nr:AAA family ATPase [Alteromonadaceae bacterium]
MKVITTLSRKGGSGKTTLMRALADAAVSQGHSTLAIDADPQKALFRWHQSLDHETPLLTVQELDDPNALEAMLAAANGQAEYVFIDTLGAGGMWADILVEQSDFLICPMMPTQTDFRITCDTFEYYQQARDAADDPSLMPPFSVVLTRMPSKPTKSMILAAQSALGALPVIDEMFLERSQHGDVDREGLMHTIADNRRDNPIPLLRTHERHYRDAVREARTILEQIEASK